MIESSCLCIWGKLCSSWRIYLFFFFSNLHSHGLTHSDMQWHLAFFPCSPHAELARHTPAGFKMVKVSRSTNTALLLWHVLPPAPPSAAAAWVKNYWIRCNLMDCWTVNMLQLQTAVLPRVKCDGWEGKQGDIWKWPGMEEERNSACFCFITGPHTDGSLPFFVTATSFDNFARSTSPQSLHWFLATSKDSKIHLANVRRPQHWSW